jgi:mannose-1-phosphate guanylyltransferase
MDWAVILAGGSGTRFWPLSSPARPKQLLPLAGARSTADQTLDRLRGFIPLERTLLVTGAALAPALQERFQLPAGNVLIEPRAASTGPALVWATWEAAQRDPDASVLSMHADWTIQDVPAFVQSAQHALASARKHDTLVTVGIPPTRPEPGYGYILPGEPLDAVARSVREFIEKPAASVARDLITDGAMWNSGLFAWTAVRLLAEVGAHTPEIAPHLALLDAGDVAGFFAGLGAVAIDTGLLERTRRVAVVPGRFDWDDVGNWEAIARLRPADAQGNVSVGPVFAHESEHCLSWSGGTPIVLSGVKDLVVVEANGRILVMDRARSPELKATLDALPPELRELPS